MDEPELIPPNFLGLAAAASAYESARVVVLPVPFEATTSYGAGTRGGPDAILLASRQVETFDPETGRDLADAPIHTGALVAPDFSSPDAMTRRLQRIAGKMAADGKWVLALGGEHSITLGLVRAAAQKHKRLSVLQIDAHLDLRDAYEGSPYSHACVMRRIVEDGHRTVHVGIRNACREEVEFAHAHDLPIFWARQVAGKEDLLEAADALEGPVYVSVDVDGLDPGVIRTTGTPEPGGLGWWETMRLLERVFANHTVVGADVVELSALGDAASDFAAARLTAKLASLAL